MTDRPAHDLLRIRDAILNALTAQQAKRRQYDCDGWIAAERKVMLDEAGTSHAIRSLPGDIWPRSSCPR